MTIPNPHVSTDDKSDTPPIPGVAEGELTPDRFIYDAFISYSRENIDAADKIERDLEAFPLTREIRKELGRRHLNVFRHQ